jgi:hypothetical protein
MNELERTWKESVTLQFQIIPVFQGTSKGIKSILGNVCKEIYIKCILEGNENFDKGNTRSILLGYGTVSIGKLLLMYK